MAEWVVQIWKTRRGMLGDYVRYNFANVDEVVTVVRSSLKDGVETVQIDRFS